jgi:predicted nucleotide-binding protein
MYLDKKKLRELLKKAEGLVFNVQLGYGTSNNQSPEKSIQQLITGLTGWLKNNPSLSNGPAYGKKLAEIKQLTSTIMSGRMLYQHDPNKVGKSVNDKLIKLIKTIDKENKSIFIVHGRDANMRDSVQSALRGLGIPNVILSNEDDHGQTIIEKFIKEADRCEYAIVLCSADDEGRLRIKGKRGTEIRLNPRARQNVILELGYFLAKYGRENLFVLHPEESIEQPSDFIGVVYQTFDKAGLWKQKLVRELKHAGFKVNDKLSDRI